MSNDKDSIYFMKYDNERIKKFYKVNFVSK